MDLTWLLIIVLLLLLGAFAVVRFMSAKHDTFRKMGVVTPPVSRLLGNLHQIAAHGPVYFHQHYYNEFKDHKVYGLYEARFPSLVIRDLDMVRDVTVKHFNCFSDRQIGFDPEEEFGRMITLVQGDEWKKLRSAVTPTFTSGRLRRMSQHVEKVARRLVDNLKEKQERGENVELKQICGYFTLDVIISTVLGIEVDTFKDPENPIAKNALEMTANFLPYPVAVLNLVFPKIANTLSKLGFRVFPTDAIRRLTQLVDSAVETRKQEGLAGKIHDFLDLMTTDESKSLTKADIHGVALQFIFAGLDTTSSALSFTTFLLAMHQDCCRKAQEEIDRKLGDAVPDFDNVHELTYLDMCLQESLRIYCLSFSNRVCTQDVEIQGIHIPKGMVVVIPIRAIHHDPDIWPEPETFDPERFTAENKAARHPYAHLPFGQGPRNCIGMRLALQEIKVALVALLQVFTPVACEKTVFPATPKKECLFTLEAEGKLWVKMTLRK